MYTSMGTHTCEGLPASLYHQDEDAATFASWGITFLKVDTCGLILSQYFWPEPHYRSFRNKLPKSIQFSVCNWGFHSPWAWSPGFDSWRTTMDIFPTWWRVLQILDYSAPLYKYARTQGYNDLDMLECGVNGTLFNWPWMPAIRSLTPTECASHFQLWAFVLSPLVIGMDLVTTPKIFLDIVSDAKVIALQEDPLESPGRKVKEHRQGWLLAPNLHFDGKIFDLLGIQDLPAFCLYGNCSYHEIWAKPMSGNKLAILFFNRGGTFHNANGFSPTEDVSVNVADFFTSTQKDCSFVLREVTGPNSFSVDNNNVVAHAVPTKGTSIVILEPTAGCNFIFSQPPERLRMNSNVFVSLLVFFFMVFRRTLS